MFYSQILNQNQICNSFPYTYKFVSKVDALPVTLDEVKAQLRIPLTDASQNDQLTCDINAVSNFFECFTNTYLITTTFNLLADCWQNCYELRRSQLQSVESVKYLDTDNAEQTVSADDYYNTDETYYSKVVFEDTFDFPQLSTRLQNITIQFKVGFGDADTDIPCDIKQALLEHITFIYNNRGDCIDAACSNLIPLSTKMAYNKYKIPEIGGC